MTLMEIKDILIVVLPLVTAAVLGYYFSKKKEIELKINEEKTRRYENLITYLSRGFMDSDTSDNDKAKNKKIFYEQSYIVWLYASDEVIKNLNDFAKAFANPAKNKNSEEKKKVGKCLQKLIYSMRKDIKGKTTLKSEEFITTTVLKGSGNG